MQNPLQLPTKLELSHFQRLPKSLKVTEPCKQISSLNGECCEMAKLVKSYLPVTLDKHYPQQFIDSYILIKLNSLCKKQCRISYSFLQQLAALYNGSKPFRVAVCYSQAEMLSQICSQIQEPISLQKEQFLNIIQGNALLATSAIFFLQQSYQYLKKQQFAFCLSFISLGGREMAFLPIVHKQKNHEGQIYFAKRISQLFHVTQKPKKQQSKVQDPYSMRCSPQVHGIAYDCYWQLQKTLAMLINKPHFKYIQLGGKKIPNLLLQSDTFCSKMDYLISCLQEIGAMSLLRSERILNSYLGKNNLKQHPQYDSLLSMLKTALLLASKNKILCQMINCDSSNVESYNKDIYVGSGAYYNKVGQLLNNLHFLMEVELLSSMEALKQAFREDYAKLEFINKQMQEAFLFLNKQISLQDKASSLLKLKNRWII